MDRARLLIRADDLADQSLPKHLEEPMVAAVLAAALLAYRRRLSLVDQENTPTGSGVQWHTVARWQQLAPTAQHPLRRQG